MDTNTLSRFLQAYFSHYYFKNHPKRITLVASLGKDLQQKDVAAKLSRGLKGDAAKAKWLHLCRPFGDGTGNKLTANAKLLKLNEQGYNIYYVVNPNNAVESRTVTVSNRQVTACIYMPIDWDNALPAGPKEIFRTADISPWMIYRTSNFDNVAHYQALIALETAQDKAAIAETYKVCTHAADVFGSDRRVASTSRLCRLPGSINWKKGAPGDFVDGAEGLLLSLPAKRRTYTRQTAFSLLQKFAGKELSTMLINSNPDRISESEAVVLETLASRSRGKGTSKYPRWKAALEAGKVVARKGKRHDALMQWTGELSEELLRARMIPAQVKQTLWQLAKTCCGSEGGIAFGEEAGEEAEINHAYQYCLDTVKRNKEALFAELGPIDADSGVTASSVVNTATLEKDLAAAYSHCVKLFCTEDTGWQPFLGAFLLGIREYKSAGETYLHLLPLFEKRLQQLNLMQDGEMILALVRKNAWGEDVHTQLVASEKAYQLFLGMLLQQLVKKFEDKEFRSSLVNNDTELRSALGKLWKECQADSEKEVVGEGDGGKSVVITEVDQREAKKLYTRKEDEFFNCSLRERQRALLCEKISCAVINSLHTVNNEARLIMQNGVYDGCSGVWTSDKAAGEKGELPAHRRWPNVLYCKFDVSMARSMRDEVLGGSTNGMSSMTEKEKSFSLGTWLSRRDRAPLFKKFLSDMFPDDEQAQATLVLMLGYCMMQQNPFAKIFFLFGDTCTGKSTFCKLMRNLIGETNTYTDRYAYLDTEHSGIAHWPCKNAVFLDEVGEAKPLTHKAAIGVLKAVTGGECILGRKIRSAPKQLIITAKPIILANNMIEYEDMGGAFKRRLVNFRLMHTIPPDKRDPYLVNKILTSESACIATVAAVWLRSHYHFGEGMWNECAGDSPALKDANIAVDEGMNPLRTIMQQAIEEGSPANKVPTEVLTKVISRLCEVEGEQLKKYWSSTMLLSKEISSRMADLFPLAILEKRTIRCWKGIKINQSRILEVWGVNIMEDIKRSAIGNKELIKAIKFL